MVLAGTELDSRQQARGGNAAARRRPDHHPRPTLSQERSGAADGCWQRSGARNNSAAQWTRPLTARFVRWQRDERRAPRAGRPLEDWPIAVLCRDQPHVPGHYMFDSHRRMVLGALPASARDINSSSVRSSMLRIIRRFCVWTGFRKQTEQHLRRAHPLAWVR